jgi:hypothetical protein
MASRKIGNRVKQTSTHNCGTGTINLLGAAPVGYVGFVAGIGNGNLCPYLIDDAAGNWEYGLGTVVDAVTDQLQRTTVLASSNGGALVNFSGVSKDIVVLPFAQTHFWPGESDSFAETDIASAATCDLGTLYTFRARITGTTTITSFGSQPNSFRIVRFAGILTLTHNATSLILRNGANVVTAAGDVYIFASDASGNWREVASRTATLNTNAIACSGDVDAANLTASAAFVAAGGIVRFPAAQVPSGAANDLDDYEEGTWTPVLSFSPTAGAATYNNRAGYYTKIGNAVVCRWSMEIAGIGGGVGFAQISSYPFAPTTNVVGACGNSHSANVMTGTVTGMYESLLGGQTTSKIMKGISTDTITDANFASTGMAFAGGIAFQTS